MSIDEQAANPVEAPDLRQKPDNGGDRRRILPPDCVVTPLGFKGSTQYFLDHAQQLRDVAPDGLRKGELLSLFGSQARLEAIWPQKKWNKDLTEWEVVDFNQKVAQSDLIEGCARMGIFDPQGRVFGRGAHVRARDGALIFHLGDRVLIVGGRDKKGETDSEIREHRPGMIGRHIFPARAALPPPAGEPAQASEAAELQAMLDKWRFEHPVAARELLLGFAGVMFVCGALPWRPHVWLTADTAAGKSTLQKLFRYMLGEFGIFTEDASEASVRQILGDDTLPVLIDEAEADDNPERQRAMVNLARKASSGAIILRGSSDHKAKEFTAQSAFMLSSILHSPMDPQDRNRFAIINMLPLSSDAVAPDIDPVFWREMGARFQRRMIAQWPRFSRTLADYKLEIHRQGFVGRWQDTFGTLLACADMLTHEAPPSVDGDGRQVRLVQYCLPMMARSRIETEDTTERCITHLTSALLPGAAGKAAWTVGRWIEKALYPNDMMEFDAEARMKLRDHGMRIINIYEAADKPGKLTYTDCTEPKAAFLAVAFPTNAGMRDIFKGTKWAGGPWTQALARSDGYRSLKVHFAGKSENAVCVRISHILGEVRDY